MDNILQAGRRLRFADGAVVALAICAACFCWLIFLIPYAVSSGGAHVSISGYMAYYWSQDQWQHCWLVLPAIAVIIYCQRGELVKIAPAGSVWGLPVLAAAFASYWLGYRVDNFYFGFLAVQLLVGGIIIWFGGWKWMKALAFAYGFMLFLWPVSVFESVITFPLRLLMAHSSVAVLNIIGIPAIQDGSGILSAANPMMGLAEGKRFSVDVADPCSGIRSLIALTMVSALYGYFTMKTSWQKWLLFFSAVPLAILGNLCRIVMLVFGVIAVGSETAIGSLDHPSFFHELAGYLVFIVALLGMVGLGAALLRVSSLKPGVRAERRTLHKTIPAQGAAPDPMDQAPKKHQDLY